MEGNCNLLSFGYFWIPGVIHYELPKLFPSALHLTQTKFPFGSKVPSP